MQSTRCRADSITRAQFILEKPGDIASSYELALEKLGEGASAVVLRGIHKATGVVRAAKKILKAGVQDLVSFRQEVAIMKIMDHPNIIRLFETFEDQSHVYLVMECCQGGELFDRIVQAKYLSEPDTAVVMQDVLRAVHYMHGQDITHRDLKPENFLLFTKGPTHDNVLKLIDFGTARTCTPKQTLFTKVGTSYYIAPQVLLRRYGRECDIWSAGAIMYTLLSGKPPFAGKNDHDVLMKVRTGRYTLEGPVWQGISKAAKDLIRMLLNMVPRARFTAKQALDHAWIKKAAPRTDVVSLGEHDVDKLGRFKCANRLKKAALQIIAGQLCEPQLKRLRDQFMLLDIDSRGMITVDELSAGLERAGIKRSRSDVQRIVASVDTDGTGVIHYTAFLAAALDSGSYLDKDLCKIAFNVFDLDGDGLISGAELCRVLDSGSCQLESEVLLQKIDRNGDGMIDFGEFMEMMAERRACTPMAPGATPCCFCALQSESVPKPQIVE